MIDFTPGPIAAQLGPVTFPWYGIGYAVGLFLAAWVIMREAKRRGFDPDIVPNGMIVVSIAALVGGRAYHVIDQWSIYRDDLLKIVLPPYSGLGAYGGLATGIIALFLYTRRKNLSFWTWLDIAAPGVFVMQAVARWGNFFNQELYGPPTNLPWGIAIQCANRVAAYACPPGNAASLEGTFGTTPAGEHFQPLFLYESVSGLIGALTLLFLARRFGSACARAISRWCSSPGTRWSDSRWSTCARATTGRSSEYPRRSSPRSASWPSRSSCLRIGTGPGRRRTNPRMTSGRRPWSTPRWWHRRPTRHQWRPAICHLTRTTPVPRGLAPRPRSPERSTPPPPPGRPGQPRGAGAAARQGS